MNTILEDKGKGFELIKNDAGILEIHVLCGGIGMFIAKITLTRTR